MTSSESRRGRVLVIGGGISGLTAVAALGRKGWAIDLIERKPRIDDGGGIGLTLVANAMRALDIIGVADTCIKAGMPADVMKMMKPDGSFLAENPLPRIGGPEWPGGTSIRRAALHEILLGAARPFANIRCGITAMRWEDDGAGVDVTFSDGSGGRYDLVVAADGINSDMRKVVMPEAVPKLSGQGCWRAPVPRPESVRCTHLFVGGRHGVVGICPVSEELAYAYLVQSDDGSWRDEATLDAQLRAELEGYGGLVAEVAAQITDPRVVNFSPLPYFLAPRPWGKGRIIMIGDAVHANPPVLAQGAAMGIEDAVVLGDELGKPDVDIDAALASFVERRFDRVRHVVEASCQLARLETEHQADLDVGAVMRDSVQRLAEPV